MERGIVAILLFFGLFVVVLVVGKFETDRLDAAGRVQIVDPGEKPLVEYGKIWAPQREELLKRYTPARKKTIEDADTLSVGDMRNLRVGLITSHGTLVLRLLPDAAPETTRNFIGLVGKTWYNNRIFGRVVKDEIIQGGSGRIEGMGARREVLPLEIGADAPKHVAGAVAMAAGADGESSNAGLFFICLTDRPDLDGKNAVFAELIDGTIETARRIGAVEVLGEGVKVFRPVELVVIIEAILMSPNVEM